jgi:hypothetical protein
MSIPSTASTTNLLGAGWRARPGKRWRFDAELEHADIDNPFMVIDGACSTLESSSYPNPFNPQTPQYHDFQDARIADTTASPSSWDQLRAALTYLAGSSTLSGSFRRWDGENSDGDLTDWSRGSQTATITYWRAPSETFDWYLAGAWQDSQLESPACIPVFDG